MRRYGKFVGKERKKKDGRDEGGSRIESRGGRVERMNGQEKTEVAREWWSVSRRR